MKNVFKTIGAIFLIMVALLLFIVITPLALVWKITVNAKRKEFKTGVPHYFVEIAASFDQLGNAVFGGFFTWLFISENAIKRHGYYSFGDKDETISEVLGWNEHLGVLSGFGESMVFILDFLDKNHCKIALENGIKKAKLKFEYSKKLNLI